MCVIGGMGKKQTKMFDIQNKAFENPWGGLNLRLNH